MDGKNNEVDHNKVDDVMLPGFRFHPTDEELVGFYLKRKILQHSLPIELIKQVDIYKYDPWDLPKLASSCGEKEWYFYCPRDRKYRNSTRPNRVTGAGFWKATGTDRPIYSSDGTKCIGLKKSLVFYRGRAAKGIKTDWMMHEFRLPSLSHSSAPPPNKLHFDKNLPLNDSWAICRIFKKISSIAHRALWISPPVITPTDTTAPVQEIFNHRGAGTTSNFADFVIPDAAAGNMSSATPTEEATHNDNNSSAAHQSCSYTCNINDHLQQYNYSNPSALSSLTLVPPYYKPASSILPTSSMITGAGNPTTDHAHDSFILGFPKSSPTVDFSSLFLNLTPVAATPTTTQVAKTTETIHDFGRSQPQHAQFNGLPMINLLHDQMQGRNYMTTSYAAAGGVQEEPHY